jgi:hypothetical protein
MVETAKSANARVGLLRETQPQLPPEKARERRRQAAATRGAGSTVSEGCAGLLNIVTSEKPTAIN